MFDVLIVEDEPACTRLLEKCVSGNRWLNLAGVAATKQQAIDNARRLRPALVLLDFGLPESRTAGFDVWDVLRELEPQPDVIAVTGIGEMSTVVKARKCGAFDYGWNARPWSRSSRYCKRPPGRSARLKSPR